MGVAERVESESVVDLVFAVDGSGSICDPDPSRWKYSSGCDNWEQIINFITEFVTVMEPSETGTHVGLVSFSTEGRLLAGLSWYYSADSMNEYIKGNLTYPGGDTNTTGGLEMTKDKVIGQAGDRETVRNVVVVITDGFPTFPKPNPRQRALDMANLLKEKADVFAVGVTSDIDDSFLSDISSGGVKDVNWFHISNFEGLKEIIDPVVQQGSRLSIFLLIKGRENWLKIDFESLFDAPKMIPMPGPHKEYHP
ncbi:hypothetical protein CAPTEDRAFT_198253 [Capitella teleta]|uniref:VWFA domain-containing protein n=1 Tax=Capitella teleta TaxID=283909 RepID=R7UCB0_CAPTE|nr:hypothetical protein CAPTEDRAFT_198253 [Capitella teleta]|eukprot:ELU04000.1 hypothetical protein CAPTEDRAFT_198253 [Capitella teleta]